MIIGITGTFGAGKSTVSKIVARIVFKDKQKLLELERIVHPSVIANIRKETSKEKNFIIDAPLLIETGLHKLCYAVIVVRCDETTRIFRLKKKGFSLADIKSRTKRQLPLKEKIKYADYVIDNSGSLEEMRRQISLLTRKLFPVIGKSQRGHRIVFGGIS